VSDIVFEDVIASYLTAGGSTVDRFAEGSICNGCGDLIENQIWHSGPAADREAHKLAQAHAEKCRAMPRSREAK
jgi:hypothetical protein